MLTVDQTISYLEHRIAESGLAGDQVDLRLVQTAAGVMMAAAQSVGDNDSAQRFRFVAAHAANKLDELTGNDD